MARDDDVTCFVCAEDAPPLYRVCRCSTWVHGACFQRMIVTVPAHAHACAVCGHVYQRASPRRACDALLGGRRVVWCVALALSVALNGVFVVYAVSVSSSLATSQRHVEDLVTLLVLAFGSWYACIAVVHLRNRMRAMLHEAERAGLATVVADAPQQQRHVAASALLAAP